jgi:hypothetical protein
MIGIEQEIKKFQVDRFACCDVPLGILTEESDFTLRQSSKQAT